MKKGILSKETLAVAVLTFTGYFIGLLYEIGYSKYYDFPLSLISVDIKSIVVGSASIAALVFLSFVFISFIYTVAKSLGAIGKVIIYSASYGSLFLYLILVNYLFTGAGGKYFYALIGTYVILTILNAPIKFNKKTFSLEMVQATTSKESPSINPVKDKFRQIEGDVKSCVMLIMIISVFILATGAYSARIAKEFYAFNKDSEQYAIVRIYGENLLTKRIIDKKTTKGTYIFKADDISGLKLENVVVESNM